MSRKLNTVEQSIFSALEKAQPSMLLWRELKARLYPIHKDRYKNKKIFGVALSNYLTKNEGKLWKHEGDFWGTLKSSPPEGSHEPPKTFLRKGFFGWLEARAERKKKKKKELELRACIAARRELIDTIDTLLPEKSPRLVFEEYLHKHRKRYGLE